MASPRVWCTPLLLASSCPWSYHESETVFLKNCHVAPCREQRGRQRASRVVRRCALFEHTGQAGRECCGVRGGFVGRARVVCKSPRGGMRRGRAGAMRAQMRALAAVRTLRSTVVRDWKSSIRVRGWRWHGGFGGNTARSGLFLMPQMAISLVLVFMMRVLMRVPFCWFSGGCRRALAKGTPKARRGRISIVRFTIIVFSCKHHSPGPPRQWAGVFS